jgi:hypothetical protein
VVLLALLAHEAKRPTALVAAYLHGLAWEPPMTGDRAREPMPPEECPECGGPFFSAKHLRRLAALEGVTQFCPSCERLARDNDLWAEMCRLRDAKIATLERDRDVWRQQADEARDQSARLENALSDLHGYVVELEEEVKRLRAFVAKVADPAPDWCSIGPALQALGREALEGPAG